MDETESKLSELERQGFTVVPGAIPPELLVPIREAFDATCDAIRRTKPREHWSQESNDEGKGFQCRPFLPLLLKPC